MKSKGFTLTEVLVAISLFTLGVFAVLTCYLVAKRAYQKQEEYLYFEAVCYDIDAYGDKYKREWDVYYFGIESASDSGTYYYNSNYKQTEAAAAKYTLTYSYNTKGSLIVSIYNNSKAYYVIENLDYGSRRYAAA